MLPQVSEYDVAFLVWLFEEHLHTEKDEEKLASYDILYPKIAFQISSTGQIHTFTKDTFEKARTEFLQRNKWTLKHWKQQLEAMKK